MISVIVPVYNCEKYIHRCIDSILSQSFTDFELLLINDGSTDSSGVICDEYSQKDNRVRVFHKTNGGVSSARNLGLDESRGEYVTFVDSDDYILEDFFSLAYKLNTDLFVGSFVYNGEIVSLDEFDSDNLLEDTSLIEYFIRSMHIHSVWGKFFKLLSINNNNLRFDETLITCEDTLFMFNYLNHVKSVILSKRNVYFYEKQNDLGLSSYKSSEWSFESTLIEKLYTAYDILQFKYQINLDTVRIFDCQIRVDSFVKGLKLDSLSVIYKKLMLLVYDEKLNVLWNDKTELQKGERRVLFDFLVKKKQVFLLSFYVKYINPRY